MSDRRRFRPIWLRPAAVFAIVLLHVAGVAIARGVAVAVVPSAAPILELAPAPEPAEERPQETAAVPETPPEPEPPPPVIPPPPEPVVEKIAKKPVEKPRPPPVRRKPPEQAPSAEARAASEAAAASARAAAASYAAQVAAELARHKRYPESARAARIQGSATLSFVIGPSGALVSHSIVRSTGNAQLDEAVHAMALASRLGPPPGGRYASSVPVNFSITR